MRPFLTQRPFKFKKKKIKRKKKLKRIMSHEAMSLEYKQAAQDESVQW